MLVLIMMIIAACKSNETILSYQFDNIWPQKHIPVPTSETSMHPRIFASPQDQLFLLQNIYSDNLYSVHLLYYENGIWQDTYLHRTLTTQEQIVAIPQFTSNGDIYIGYINQETKNVHFLRWKDKIWQEIGLFTQNANHRSFIISNDEIYILWANNNQLSLGKWSSIEQLNDNTFMMLSTTSFNGQRPQLITIANQDVFILSFDSNSQFRVMQWKESLETIGVFQSELANYPFSLNTDVTQSGDIYLSWAQALDEIMIAKWSLTQQAWQNVPSIEVPNLFANNGTYEDIQVRLDKNDQLFITYTYFARENIFVATLVDNQWVYIYDKQKETPNLSTDTINDFPQLTFTSDGQAFLSWMGRPSSGDKSLPRLITWQK